jgi:hypothetical protein
MAWKKPAWTRGKVFVRYTGEHNRIRYKSSGKTNKTIAARGILTGAQTNLLRDESSPLLYVPYRLIADNPNQYYNEDDRTSEQR